MRFNDYTILSDDNMRQPYYVAWAYRLQQHSPPQVLLSDPVVLYDALDKRFEFFLECIDSAEVISTRSPQKNRNI